MRGKWTPQVGDRFGRLIVLDTSLRLPPRRPGRMGDRRFLCLCDCGTQIQVIPYLLYVGKTASCGCLWRESHMARLWARRTHGLSTHPLHKTWSSLLRRCENPDDRAYKNYGGRGIRVYGPWRESPTPFVAWIEENLGPRPEGYTLDRVDNDGNYEPGNLRWADYKTQNNNKRRPAMQTRSSKLEKTSP